MTQPKVDRTLFRRMLNQALLEGKELQQLEAAIHSLRQLAASKRARVKNFQQQAEELERTRLLAAPLQPTRNPTKGKPSSKHVSLKDLEGLIPETLLQSLKLKGGKNAN